ncbi:hypothetical protein BGZ76_007328 [Entomortierella beljakovae]|nr:hypothetical protein BGZ76_007328 [Entomortierella beljakovae]
MVLFNLGSLSDMMNLVLPQNSMTEVRILWKTSYTTSLGILLTLCPMIRRLHIEGCSGYSRFIEESVEPWHSTSVKPKESGIKYLVVNWMCIESNRLEAILGRCPQLETLKLIKIFSSSSYGSSLYRTRIFNAVAVSCPQLKRFHLSIFDRFMTAVNISPWSNLYSWEFSQSIPIHVGQETIGQDQNGIQSQQLLLDTVSVLDRDINKATVSAIFAPILDTSFEKIITTLEIIPTNNFNHYDYIGDALHTFLCSAPSLVHLLAPGVHCYVDYLNLHDMSLAVDASSFGFSQERNSEFIVRNRRRATWACRGLKTLQIKFMSRNFVDSATPRNSRIMFGYIATVCPNLVELYIDRQSLNLKLEGGFCLLSRLQYLQKLIIQTRTVTKLEMEDISWMSHYPLLESNSVTETKLRSRVYAKLCSKLTFLKRGPRPLNKKDIMDGARKVSEKAKGAEDFEDFGSMENLRECLLSLTEQQGTEGKNCWPQLEFLGLSLYLLHKKEIVHLEKYLPIMISQLRPG